MSVWPAAIAAGSSLLGGLVNSINNDAAQGRAADAANNANQMQLNFARTGIQWRAEDVMAAYKFSGIHPLALLGVQGPTYSPVNMVGGGNNAMGDAIGNAGQGIARAMTASASDETRIAAMKPLMDLQLQRGGLENELLKVRIASETARLRQELSPSMPTGTSRLMAGQGNSPLDTLRLITGTTPEKVNEATPDMTYIKSASGHMPVPSTEAKKLIEDDWYQQLMFAVRNNIAPWFGHNTNPPGPASARTIWKYDPVDGYREVPRPYSSPHGSARRSTAY